MVIVTENRAYFQDRQCLFLPENSLEKNPVLGSFGPKRQSHFAEVLDDLHFVAAVSGFPGHVISCGDVFVDVDSVVHDRVTSLLWFLPAQN
jgi:hypothetical protein